MQSDGLSLAASEYAREKNRRMARFRGLALLEKHASSNGVLVEVRHAGIDSADVIVGWGKTVQSVLSQIIRYALTDRD
jgi:hypothetical protein